MFNSAGGKAEIDSKKNTLYYHGIFMWVCWFIFGMVQVGTQRWWKKEWKYNGIAHMITGTLVCLGTLFSSADIIIRYGFNRYNNHPWEYSITFASFPIAVSGFIDYYYMQNADWGTRKLRIIKKFHAIIGFAFVFIGIFICANGMKLWFQFYEPKYENLAMVQFWVQIGIILVAEIHYQIRYRGEVPLQGESYLAHVNITEMEFEERVKNGEKLWILDDLVLDLSEYQEEHPGGKFLIEYNMGRDISKFFYGGHALDGNRGPPKAASEISP